MKSGINPRAICLCCYVLYGIFRFGLEEDHSKRESMCWLADQFAVFALTTWEYELLGLSILRLFDTHHVCPLSEPG